MNRRIRIGVLVAALALALVFLFVARESDDTPVGKSPITDGTVPPSSAPRTNSTLSATQLSLIQVATVDAPTNMATRPGETNLYVTEQGGRIRRIRPTATDPYDIDDQPVLDITELVTSGGERGLLGLGFSPDGKTVYVGFTNTNGDQELDSYAIPGDIADPASRRTLLVIDDFAPNHNGGDIHVDRNGLLYWTMGDGGGASDPRNSGQNPNDLLGNILRIDPSKPSGTTPYSIPPDNPFADGKGGAPEVWMYGLRNPWRMSFDRETGDLWIGDVGQNEIEEIDFVPAPITDAHNFGWSDVEGTHPFHENRPPDGATAPIYEYDHSGSRCSITGGYVYRGSRTPDLRGTYLFADYCDGEIHGLIRAPDGAITVTTLGMVLPGLSSFGEDTNGELYALSTGGPIGRIDGATVEPTTSTTSNPSTTTAAAPASASGNAAREPQVSDDPVTAARQLVAAEQSLRDPATTPQVVSDDARIQQLAYRYLGAHPEFDAVVIEQVPAELRDAVTANLEARRELAAIGGSTLHDELPAWRIEAPAPAEELLDAYRDAEEQFGVGWNYLAAINLIETGFGRIHGLSSAGAQGPMQFMPATWDAFGEGDVNAPRDAIMGAGRYLAHNGFPDGNVDGALFRYNNSQHYVNAVKAIASVLGRDPRAFTGYYGWDVFYATTAGVVRLDVGYEQSEPVSAADYVAANPGSASSEIESSHSP